jgi:hypothetical protein
VALDVDEVAVLVGAGQVCEAAGHGGGDRAVPVQVAGLLVLTT